MIVFCYSVYILAACGGPRWVRAYLIGRIGSVSPQAGVYGQTWKYLPAVVDWWTVFIGWTSLFMNLDWRLMVRRVFS